MTTTEDVLRHELGALLPRLRRFARALTRHREDADDLVQIAVERALTRAHQWQSGSRLDSWIFRIMQNAWIDEVRARSRAPLVVMDEDMAEAAAETASAGGVSPADALAVRQAVGALSDEHRSVVALVLVEGLPYKEAAEVLGIPVGTLTSRLARARGALQGQLNPAA